MLKSEFVAKVAETAGITKAAASNVIEALTVELSAVLADGDSVSIAGFGSFSVAHRASRTGRNPSTGETIQIPASVVARFTAGKALKELLNSEKKKPSAKGVAKAKDESKSSAKGKEKDKPKKKSK